MSLSDILNCAPFRLAAPRDLTPFEWGVVQTALARSMNEVVLGMGSGAEPSALAAAMRVQTPCPAWRTSAFGPEPAVATYWYRCFARWYAQQAPAIRAQIVAQIPMGFLCASNPPWAACDLSPRAQGMSDLWEGGPQKSDFVGAATGCEVLRDRTVYAPVTGQDLVKMLSFLNTSGQLPMQLSQLANLAPDMFLTRSFLLGVQAKQAVSPNVFAVGGSDLTALALSVLEDVVLIWAPGQGMSLLDWFKGGLNPNKLIAFLGAMAPDLVGQLGAMVPGLMQNLPALATQFGPQLGQLFGAATQLLPQLLGSMPVPMAGFGECEQANCAVWHPANSYPWIYCTTGGPDGPPDRDLGPRSPWRVGFGAAEMVPAQPGTKSTGLTILDRVGATIRASSPLAPQATLGIKTLWIGAAMVVMLAAVAVVRR